MKRTFKSMFVSLLPVFLVAVSGLLAANLPARAQPAQTAPGNAMLVLDASGSMWGQIEGISKMQIAREVVSNMLDNWNPKRNLGLMAYGHRRKGDCGDIQTLARVGPVDPVAMKALVNSLNPRGKTPISAAVRLAAEGLKYSEEKATVILVSDGLETCAGDPPVNACAMARELEQTGVDLTVHVIGFDLADQDTSSLQCIAEETGGRYFSASSAGELSTALEAVAAPTPSPGPAIYAFRATQGANGPQIDQGLLWFLTNLATNETPLNAAGSGGGLAGIELAPGTYRIEALRNTDEQIAAMEFTVAGNAGKTLTLVLPLALPAATVTGPAEAPAGTSVQVTWTGPNGQGDSIAVVKATAEEREFGNYVYTQDGSPLQLRLPETPGDYEFRYLWSRGTKKVLARAAVTITASQASLEANDTVGIGASLAVTWAGPNNPGDYITIVEPEAKPREYGNYTYTKPGSPLQVVAPDRPGNFEIRYVTGQERRILARRALLVENIEVTLAAAPAVPLGSQVAVAWTGPDNQGDYITIVEPGAKARIYGSYAYTKSGSPAQVRAPETPGTFEIRYISGQSKSILTTRSLVVQSVNVTLSIPPQVPAGSIAEVAWTGPDNSRDYITIVKPQAKPRDYGSYKYTQSGSPLKLQVPDAPGAYQLRYITGANKRVLFSVPVTVTAVTASLQAPASAPAGSLVEIAWQGPNNKNDFIAIVKAGAKEKTYLTYKRTFKGTPVAVQVPDRGGAYEIRYINGKSRTTLARRPITASPISATLDAPAEIQAGDMLSVAWQGPNNKNDYVIFVPAGAKPKSSRSTSYGYTAKGTPLEIRAPKKPGAYQLHYLSGQSRRSLASRAITVR